MGGRATVQQEETTVELRYTKEDHIAAQKLHSSLSSSAKWLHGLLISLGALAYILLTLRPVAWSYISRESWLLWIVIYGSVGGVAFSLIWRSCLSWFYLPFVAARNFKKHPTAQLPERVTLTPEGIRCESDRGVFTLLWKDFIKWRANSEVILAYLSPQLFMIYPARLATAGFPIDRLKETLTRELGPPER